MQFRFSSINKLLTRGDNLLILFVLIASLASLLIIKHLSQPGKMVVVKVAGQITHQLPLQEDREIQVTGPLGLTKIQIKNQKVRIVASACPNKTCVKSGWISSAHHLLVCVPNQVVINISGEPNYYFDVSTH